MNAKLSKLLKILYKKLLKIDKSKILYILDILNPKKSKKLNLKIIIIRIKKERKMFKKYDIFYFQ